jgi:dCTP diphosphatase
MREFPAERDWERLSRPKSLLLAFVGEVGELSELVQWLPPGSARQVAAEEPLHTRVREELADVPLYFVRLVDVLDVDLRTAEAKFRRSSSTRPSATADCDASSRWCGVREVVGLRDH